MTRDIADFHADSVPSTDGLRHLMRRILIIILVVFVAYLGWEFVTLPSVGHLAKTNPHSTAWMQLREREAIDAGRKPRRLQRWVSLSAISRHLKNAVLIAEDAAFFQHKGLDYAEIREAVKVNSERGEFVRGASTITQQLAKNLYLSPSRNPIRKLKELWITFQLERQLSKQRIFDIYLNVIEWGDGVYGAEAASRFHFEKPSSELSAEEAAALAAVIINPRRYSPVKPNRRILNRIEIIRNRMEKLQYYR